ncbi:MAG: hypothetical protein GF313_10760 [Caldithrix sp.]|nr:hypothetical protein [Caldithrix sp.]
MNKKQKNEREIERTLEAFDHLTKISANAFFMTRIENQLKQEQQWGYRVNNFGKLLTPARAAALTMFTILNIVSGIFFFQDQKSQMVIHNKYLSTIASEYALERQNEDILNQMIQE